MISNDPTRPADLRITRAFDAPRALVFEAWTKAEHVSKWFAPAPLTVSACELDFRPGGVFHLVMRAPDGTEYPMNAVFREIVTKTRLQAHQVYSKASDATRGAHAGWTATLDQLGQFVLRS